MIRKGHHCSVCKSPLVFLGQLGGCRHYRCRGCGIDVMMPLTKGQTKRRDDRKDDSTNGGQKR